MNPILIGAKLALSDYGKVKPIHLNSGIVSAMKYNKTSLLILYYSIANIILKPIARHKERKRKRLELAQSLIDRYQRDITGQFRQITVNWKRRNGVMTVVSNDGRIQIEQR